MPWFLLSLALILIWSIAALLGLPGGAPSERIECIRQSFSNWFTKPTNAVHNVAYVALGLSVLIGLLGYWSLLPLPQKLIDDFYANFAAEFGSIAITVLIIDRLVEWRAEQREKERIIQQMSSRSNEFALEAVRAVVKNRWIWDGTLADGNFAEANLKGASMFRANLQGADLRWADLQEANLMAANLGNTDLSFAKLQNAHLAGANLSGAILSQSELYGADLAGVNFHNAILGASIAPTIDPVTLNTSDREVGGAKYDLLTTWPEGFNPAAHGAILVEDDE